MTIPNEQGEPKTVAEILSREDWSPWEFCPNCKVNAGCYVKMAGLTDIRQVCK